MPFRGYFLLFCRFLHTLGVRYRDMCETMKIETIFQALQILAKLGNFARLAKFRYIAKITVPREILHFRYLSQFSLG